MNGNSLSIAWTFKVVTFFGILCLVLPSTAFCKRYALVVGNAEYGVNSLKNTVNDAKDMTEALDDLGFSVTTVVDASKKQMQRAVDKFSSRLSNDDVALFYYAGHAVQHNDENYLLSLDMKIEEKVDLDEVSIKLTNVMQRMAKSDMSIVVLDACRKNSYNDYYLGNNGQLTRSYRGIGLQPRKGLASPQRAMGTFIAYATDIGGVSYDGNGRNGVFTKYLLRYIKKPGYRLEDVFKRVRESVADETAHEENGPQIPWDSSSITGVFHFVKPKKKIKTIRKADRNVFTPAF